MIYQPPEIPAIQLLLFGVSMGVLIGFMLTLWLIATGRVNINTCLCQTCKPEGLN